MSTLRNSVQLIGHLGADPEMKKLDNGTMMVRLRLATTDSYKTNTGEWKDETQWHSITLWETMAERAMRQLHKGSFVLVHGKLVNRTYTDAQGIKKYVTEVRAMSVMSLDKKEAASQVVSETANVKEEHLPF